MSTPGQVESQSIIDIHSLAAIELEINRRKEKREKRIFLFSLLLSPVDPFSGDAA
jgi:hypothetical protein